MDLLSDILSRLRLSGTLYFRTSFTSPWSVRVPPFAGVARFHFAHRGRCLVRIAGIANPVQIEQGDLIIVTRGAGHTLYCDPKTEAGAILLDEVVRESGFTGSGILVHGGSQTDQETQLICGHFAFDPNASHPILAALPAFLHIRNYGERAGAWMESTLRLIGAEAGRAELGSDIIALKLSEILFAQALRSFLAGEGARLTVWSALAEPRIARALQAFHADPAGGWTLNALAQSAGMSRAAFAGEFGRRMGMTVLAYVTQWRMQIARQLLADTGLAMIEIAERAGYGSEAAFGRVFKKHCGQSPAAFRRLTQQHQLPPQLAAAE